MKSIALAAATFFAAVSSAGAAFTTVVSFGDSLSDAGNLRNATFGLVPGGPGYSNGRFSNGNVWVQNLGPKLGAPAPSASSSGGTDFAFGNATSGTDQTILTITIPSVRTQINGWAGANAPTSGQLFTVLGGANDLFAALGSGQPSAVQVAAAALAATNIAEGARTLANDGATNILVANLPDLGLVPRFRGSAQQSQATLLSDTFNATLAASLATIVNPGVRIYALDLDALFDQAIANPAAFGLTNVTTPAYTNDTGFLGFSGNGTAVADPSGYLFWDDVHPTATGHALVANAAFALIPEPASLALFAGVALLIARRRRA